MLESYGAVRARTRALAARLAPEDQMVQSMPDASPTKWHLAHTTWFFETFVLEPFVPGYARFDDRYGYLFNSYYDAVGPRLARGARGAISRPTLTEVHAYRDHVDAHMTRWLAEGERDAAAPVALGLAHEEQHQELILTDVKHAFWGNPIRPVYDPSAEEARASAPGATAWLEHAEGVAWIGHDDEGFCFDNERPRHRTFVEAFAIAARPVTCGEYLAFIQDGGYAQPSLWLSDGWRTVAEQGWNAPLYWEWRDERWWRFTLAGMRPVDLDAPVAHVSAFEADAFARWAGARLPTEAEWELAARAHPERFYGGVWEWTQSAYAAYPGYRAPDGALGEYNGKFMSGQQVLRGGSWATPPGHIRPSYRNFFPACTRWQASGIRLARDAR